MKEVNILDIVPHENKYFITEEEMDNYVIKIYKENELLKENNKVLNDNIERVYHTMISLKYIADVEIEKLEDIEEI